ncbi:MAG: proton-conducting transporter membrane subunit, partial [Actinomycetota bacterium]
MRDGRERDESLHGGLRQTAERTVDDADDRKPAIPYLVENGAGIAKNVQVWIFAGMFVGFAVKVPMFPFHTWLPDAHTQAPTQGSVILAAILLKLGTYGFVRIAIPMLPDAAIEWAPWIGGLAV